MKFVDDDDDDDDLRKSFIETSQMAKVPNGVETLPKISVAWVGRTNVTDDKHKAPTQNINLSSRNCRVWLN